MSGHITFFLDTWAERLPNKPALVDAQGSVTFAQLRERVRKLAGALQAEGLAPGSNARLFVLDKNNPATLELTLAAAWANATCVIGNWRLAPAEIEWVLNDSKASVVFVGADLAPMVESLRAKLPAVKRVVVVGGAHDEYEPFLAQGRAVERAPFSAEDPLLQLYTSGTTGFPKGAMHNHRSLGAHTEAMVQVFGFREDSVSLVPMPLFHVGGTSWAFLSMRVGATSVITRDPSPVPLLELIAQHRITHTFVVPAILQGFMMVPDFAQRDTSSLQMLLYGAAPISVPLLEKVLASMSCRFFQVYGMTEMGGVFCELGDAEHRDAAHRERLASAGKPTPGVELRVVDPSTAKEVPDGSLGEFWVRSPQCMLGYWEKPEATAQAFAPGGWLRTGDAGIRDADGYLFITDRIKDMVISGGENVYPAEVERVLQQHPAVGDVAVFGVPHEKWGETLRAEVVLRAGQSVSEAEVITFARQSLAGYKCPTQVGFRETLPRNPSGKVLKRELRAPFWEGAPRKI